MVDHVHHFKKATILAISSVIGTAVNAAIIFVLSQIFDVSPVYVGYVSSGTTGFIIYLTSVYLLRQNSEAGSDE
jgi:O-antigen/teichoic acid export membrane protein